MSARAGLITVVAVGVALVASRAIADPIIVSGGTVTIGSSGSGQDPPFGFELLGANTAIGGENMTIAFDGFQGGQDATFDVTVTPSFVNHPIPETVNGVQYSGWLGGALTFANDPVHFPTNSGGDGIFAFATPFTMTGVLSGFGDSGLAGPPLFTVDLTGRGTVGAAFRTVGNNYENISGTIYRFSGVSPTPEPMTLLTLGVGLVAVRRGLGAPSRQ